MFKSIVKVFSEIKIVNSVKWEEYYPKYLGKYEEWLPQISRKVRGMITPNI